MSIFSFRNRKGRKQPLMEQLIATHRSESPFALAGEMLMNSLLGATTQSTPRQILITSAGPNEGKTTVSAHLAITMAMARKNVLIIDADLRSPHLHEVFDLGQDLGFADVLDDTKPDDAIQNVKIQVDEMSTPRSLSVMTSGRVYPDRFKMFGSDQAREALEYLGQTFDHIIVDTPPVLAVSDAVPLMRLVDGVILVLESGAVQEGDAAAARALITRAGGRLLGVVMNRFEEKLHGPSLSAHYGELMGDRS